jgi:uncharacterized OB-fold protein
MAIDPAGKPLPEPTEVSAPFWAGLRERRIQIQFSPSTGHYVFYPRIVSPGSLRDDLQWREISGRGSLYAFTVADRPTAPQWANSLPQLLAIVEWDEGPRVSTEMVNAAPDELRVGMRVRPVFCHEAEGITLLRYEPDPEAHGRPR